MSVETRPGAADDLEQLNELYNHYVLTSPATFDVEPISMEARREWFEGFGGRYRLVVATEDGRLLGYANSKQFRPKAAYEASVETTVYVIAGAEGRGVGRMLYGSLFDALASEDIHRVYAGITMPNPASVALHERFGFVQVAYFTEQGRKFGRYWDVAWFEKAF
jgi:phosphinothricin acetyltransferase